jgi:hypothetical protein
MKKISPILLLLILLAPFAFGQTDAQQFVNDADRLWNQDMVAEAINAKSRRNKCLGRFSLRLCGFAGEKIVSRKAAKHLRKRSLKCGFNPRPSAAKFNSAESLKFLKLPSGPFSR